MYIKDNSEYNYIEIFIADYFEKKMIYKNNLDFTIMLINDQYNPNFYSFIDNSFQIITDPIEIRD